MHCASVVTTSCIYQFGRKRCNILTLHVLRHDPVVEQSVVLHRALHSLYQQVVGSGSGSVGLALGLSAVSKAGEEEKEVVDVP